MPCKLKASIENSFSKHAHKHDVKLKELWLMLIQHLLTIEAQTNI